MSRGVLGLRLPESAAVAAPVSGVHVAAGERGPIALRLFRLTGTRLAVASAPAAQLIAIRVAAAGTPVQVVTSRPALWEPLLPRQLAGQVVPSAELLAPPGGPSLVVDDRPAQARGAGELHPWQCRVDVRTDWTPADLASFAYADLAILAGVPLDATGIAASAFGLPASSAERLAHLPPGTLALLRRGRLEFGALNPTPAEAQLLEAAQGAVRVPIWR
jgi:hypothetical protein